MTTRGTLSLALAIWMAPAWWAAAAHGQPAEAAEAAPAAVVGAIGGRVVGADKAPLAGVRVVARALEGGVEQTAETGADGTFAFPNMAPGIYDVTATGQGGLVAVLRGVSVREGTATNADLTLESTAVPPPAAPPPSAPADTVAPPAVPAQPAPPAPPAQEEGAHLDIYGFAMLDLGFQFFQNAPAWFDTARPSKLPSVENEFGEDGRFFAGVRQSRLGLKGFLPTPLGEAKTIFEFELFGTGVDEGQTTFRLRHAWGELGQIGAGQTWSPFMDPDAFPNSIEYWGPSGMVFFRNVQLRWTPVSNELVEGMIAIERPGASADTGSYAERLELANVTGRFPLPDLSARVRVKGESWGHIQLAGILRYIAWDDVNDDELDLSGDAIGWGVNASANFKIWQDTLRLQAVFGYAVGNYFNDGAVDIAMQENFDDPVTPLLGVAVPALGIVAFYDRTWNEQFTSTVGYSLVNVWTTDGQAPEAFQTGQYALANILFHPVPGVMMGPEVQWVWRGNKSNDFNANDVRIQASFKYSWDYTVKGAEQ